MLMEEWVNNHTAAKQALPSHFMPVTQHTLKPKANLTLRSCKFYSSRFAHASWSFSSIVRYCCLRSLNKTSFLFCSYFHGKAHKLSHLKAHYEVTIFFEKVLEFHRLERLLKSNTFQILQENLFTFQNQKPTRNNTAPIAASLLFLEEKASLLSRDTSGKQPTSGVSQLLASATEPFLNAAANLPISKGQWETLASPKNKSSPTLCPSLMPAGAITHQSSLQNDDTQAHV